jgi:hypothetical protein
MTLRALLAHPASFAGRRRCDDDPGTASETRAGLQCSYHQSWRGSRAGGYDGVAG